MQIITATPLRALLAIPGIGPRTDVSEAGIFRIDVDEDISSSYSIGVRFEYGTIEAGWEKIIDFNNMLTDDG
ncbi:hypothetical protein, partial [Bathymodiolus platifrons methanotrophic gill symbiont]|uniref:hypothetical protein n=1 Tax=Bathymodiolus platifrons methanotrophic gill symbiont TaxID=113268 RepID=UPI001C8F1A74